MKIKAILYVFIVMAFSTQGYCLDGSMYINDNSIEIFYELPPSINNNTNILIVIPGIKRNAEEYLDKWKDISAIRNAVIVSVRFSKKLFPGRAGYNEGNLKNINGKINRYGDTVFSFIDRVYAKVKLEFALKTDGFYLYGHSAGAQMVHRYVFFSRSKIMKKAVSANAGWYTFPNRKNYPYGLGQSEITEKGLKKAFRRRLGILLGDKDIDPNHKFLNKSAGAMEQGKTRFERGNNFYSAAEGRAKKNGYRFNWSKVIVEGVGHSNKKMIPAAVNFLFGD